MDVIIEHRSLCMEPELVIDYSDYERRLKALEERGNATELRYNHNHDEKGRFTFSSGGGALKRVDKSRKSGIIKEKSNSKPITEITDQAIERVPKVEISGYTDEQCATIQKQHQELLRYARDNNNGNEVAFVFDENLQNRKEFKGIDDELDFGGSLYGKNLTVLHNHPRNSSYSFNDIVEFFGNSSIKTLTIVKNNGKVETLTKIASYDNLTLLNSLSRMRNDIVKKAPKKGKFRDELFKNEIKKFLNKNQSGGVIEWKK